MIKNATENLSIHIWDEREKLIKRINANNE